MTDTTAGGPRPSTTASDIRTMRCSQCARCIKGPRPELKEQVFDLDGVPVTVSYPVCMAAGTVYLRARMAVCLNFVEAIG